MKVIIKIIFLSILMFSMVPLYAASGNRYNVLPNKLQKGDIVGLIAPGYRIAEKIEIQYAIERMKALGLKVKVGESVNKKFGYFAGTDEERASDINKMFADKDVKAIISLRGGWGSNRILSLLDYKIIKENPKIFMGYSDITSLLLAINAKTGLITFHGPMAALSWTGFTTQYVKDILFEGKRIDFVNPVEEEDDLIQTKNRIITIRKGKATGYLLGGSITLLSTMIGSNYLPDFNGAILFVEDIEEDVYRIDRMLTQLKNAGVLDKISGFIFGKCTDCCSKKRTIGSPTLQEVLEQHILPLNIPAWYGSMIGHEDKIFTIPEGVKVNIDAEKGTIQMLDPAVK